MRHKRHYLLDKKTEHTNMETDSKLGAAADEGVTNDLMVVNELLYKIPPDLNITQVRTQKKYVADTSETAWSSANALRFTLQTGLEYVDMKNSSLEFDLETKVQTTFNKLTAADGQVVVGEIKDLPVVPSWVDAASAVSIDTAFSHRIEAKDQTDEKVINGMYNSGRMSCRASTSGGLWYIDGGLSLFEKIEIAHASGKIVQFQEQLGKIGNIKHTMEYNYSRSKLSSRKLTTTIEGIGEQLAVPFLQDMQSEMDGYQFIEALAVLSESHAVLETELVKKNNDATIANSVLSGIKFKDTGSAYPTNTVIQSRSAYRSFVDSGLTYTSVTNQSMYRDWAPGQVATYTVKTHMSIPLNRVPGLFEHPQLLPAQLLSGMRITFNLRNPEQCLTFVYNNGTSVNKSIKVEALGDVIGTLPISRNINGSFAQAGAGDLAQETQIQNTLASQGTYKGTVVPTTKDRNMYNWYSLLAMPRNTHLGIPDRQISTSFLGDVGLITGTKTDIRQSDFTHQIVANSSKITNAALVLDCYQLAPAIQRKLDTIAASGQMRIAFPHYYYSTSMATNAVFAKGNTFQLPVNVATENALWAFVGFHPTSSGSGSMSPVNMPCRYLPWMMDSYQARAGSYYFPADPVQAGMSGTWRDLLPFAKQGLRATGRLNTSNPGGVITGELLPDFFKLWYDHDGGQKLVNNQFPTKYHVSNNTMCGYWTSLERSSVLDNTGLPLNQNRQLTFTFVGGITGAQQMFIESRSGPTSKSNTGGVGGPISFEHALLLGDGADNKVGTAFDALKIQPVWKFGPTNNLDFIHIGEAAQLWSGESLSVDVFVATVQYMTILLNTIVKRE